MNRQLFVKFPGVHVKVIAPPPLMKLESSEQY